MKNYKDYWNRRYLPFVPIILMIMFDLFLSCMSWQEIRNTIGWVKYIPQKTDFKLRHIVQFSPQCFYIALLLHKKFNMRWPKYPLSIVCITFVGIISEVTQLFISSRIFAFGDIFWNFVAAIIGAILLYLYLKARAQQASSDC